LPLALIVAYESAMFIWLEGFIVLDCYLRRSCYLIIIIIMLLITLI